MHRLRTWARWPALGLASLVMIVGNLREFQLISLVIGGVIAFHLISRKSMVVFSPAYREIMAATPHIRLQMPLWIWLAILFLLLMMMSSILAYYGPMG